MAFSYIKLATRSYVPNRSELAVAGHFGRMGPPVTNDTLFRSANLQAGFTTSDASPILLVCIALLAVLVRRAAFGDDDAASTPRTRTRRRRGSPKGGPRTRPRRSSMHRKRHHSSSRRRWRSTAPRFRLTCRRLGLWGSTLCFREGEEAAGEECSRR